MITKEIWNNWVECFLQYAKKYYPDVKITEKRLLDFFSKCYTLEMEEIIERFKIEDEKEQ